ncbi:MAG: translation elongation factor Ts [candidate division Zixibacteria bacterium]|nr:translation elongation factor Ts [candidate division Zixibacteria bacterium]
MQINAQMVKELRDQTGAGMMDCKNALSEADGDLEKAVKVLREKGIAKAASKAGRTAAEGVIASYIHAGDKLGVLVEVACETDFVARTDQFKVFTRDIAMHVAATAPVCVSREEVDQAMLDKERDIYRQQALNEGKPEKVIDRIIDGKLEKYLSEIVLLEQAFVKDTDKTVSDVVKEMIAKLGENILVKRFCRFRLGE